MEQTRSRAELRAIPAPAPTDLGVVAERWQRSLDATQRALDAARLVLSGESFHARQRALAAERQMTAELLVRLARETGSRTDRGDRSGSGADRVAPSLGSLLEPRLRAAA
jgi:hypothetical protein